MSEQISVSPESKKVIVQYAKKYGIDNKEAADRMIGVAVTRLNALARYAAKNKGEAKPAAKKAVKKAAPKAKGPIARKAKAVKE